VISGHKPATRNVRALTARSVQQRLLRLTLITSTLITTIINTPQKIIN